MFCSELFGHKNAKPLPKSHKDQMDTFTKAVLPSIFQRCLYEKLPITSEAKKAITNCQANHLSPAVLLVTISAGCQTQSKNRTLIELSYTHFLRNIASFADLRNPDHFFLLDGG